MEGSQYGSASVSGFHRLKRVELTNLSLNLDATKAPPVLRVTPRGEIWVLAYWEGWLKKFDPSMNLLLSISPVNDVPGGLFSAMEMIDLEDGRAWVYLHSTNKTHEIETKTGKFIKTHKMGALGFFPFGENLLLAVGKHSDMFDQGDNYNVVVDRQATLLNSWPIDLEAMLAKSSGVIELVALQDQRVFWSTGMVPEIEISAPGKIQKNWLLSTPAGYLDPPKQSFDLNSRFDRRKVEAFYSSFTQIYGIYPVAEYGIAVCWKTSGRPFLMDVFDYRTGKRYVKTKEIPGRLTGVLSSKLYFYEYNIHFDTGQPLEKEGSAVHIWDLDLTDFNEK